MYTEHSDRIGRRAADLRRLHEATQLPLDDLLAESRAFYQALDHSNIAATSRKLR